MKRFRVGSPGWNALRISRTRDLFDSLTGHKALIYTSVSRVIAKSPPEPPCPARSSSRDPFERISAAEV